MKTAFVVEDDGDIRDLIVYALEGNGYRCVGFESGEGLFGALAGETPDVVLLDIMLPGDDGIKILRRLRSGVVCDTADTPVIMITAKGSEADKVKGLNLGADDYVTKPFGVTELIARVGAVLRRVRPRGDATSGVYVCGGVRLDETRRTVAVNGADVTFTFAEFELLRALMADRGVVLSRDKLMSAAWGGDYMGESRAVDMHVTALRRKLGDCGGIIKTVRNAGYKLDPS